MIVMKALGPCLYSQKQEESCLGVSLDLGSYIDKTQVVKNSYTC